MTTITGGDFGDVIDRLRRVTDAFLAAGHELFLVGGIVRDTMLGLSSVDVDATTSARPDEIKALVAPFASALWTQGERFGTVGARVGDLDVEITTYRAEVYDAQSRKPEIDFGDNLRADLARRDFTINAMAVSLLDATLHDPFDGARDLSDHVLRTPLDPSVSFGDDPLRMLRAARFVPRFSLRADPALTNAARSFANRLEIVSRERVHDELERLLAVPDPLLGFGFLEAAGLVEPVLGFSPPMAQWEESVRLVCEIDGLDRRRIALFAPYSRAVGERVLARLRYSTEHRTRTLRGLSLLEGLADRAPSPSGIRQLVSDADHDLELLADVLAVASAITEWEPTAAALSSAMTVLGSQESLERTDPPIDGAMIMATLGVEPGPLVGRALAHLERCRIDRGPMSRDEALVEIETWFAHQ